jgi:hypothetical protein
MENVNNPIFVNFRSGSTSVSDSVFFTPTELTDNLSFAIKNAVIIDFSIGEIEQIDSNKENQKKQYEAEDLSLLRHSSKPYMVY